MFKLILNTIPRPLLIRLSYLVKPIMTIFLKGDLFVDPIDGRGFRRFLSYGYEKKRQNVLSPSTLSLERHRLLWLYLKYETNFFNAPLKVLHFAPEQCFLKRFRQLSHLDYTTTDLNSPIADIKADICDLPFADDQYDVILCNHVLEHIPDDTKAMHELFRIMKPGGWGIFQIPQDLNREKTFEDNTITNKEERAKIFGQYDHVRVYGKDFFDKLGSVGFDVEAVDYTSEFSDAEINKFRLAKGELIPLVKKK